ncbi:DUF3300 domain-containing protein [Carboxylicivirga sp. M1479]|uniref:DUF3300 domain-containing protein n=1 Tax=Carboxylicivirga sp. M1479 TaxID=2594476 RepID=UPI001178B8E9|nr:DUF3300 domain-containing protein [Carboxylicivirga sp. M1479]TRX65692.1 DUF3300 domain-containing protein [Carboxylicivirga sp. M1479]
MRGLKKQLPVMLVALLMCLFAWQAEAQTDLAKFKEIIKKDSTLVVDLAAYDASVRRDILIVAQHPEVLSTLKETQQGSQNAFQGIIEDYDRDTQFGIYELSRYPDLIDELTIEGKLRKKEIQNVILSYPEDIHESAMEYGRKRYKALDAIAHLNHKTQKDFDDLISKYNSDFQSSIKRLIGTPEVLSTMADNLEFTRLAGSVYQQYPKEMDLKLEEWHNQIKAQKEKELADYQQKLKEDPEAYEEMLAAAEQFAAEESANKNISEPVTEQVEVVHINHYSYWYGYPYWYSAPYWRPYPWYYHTGFYYGPGGGVVFIGMPSYWYVGWHHHYYPNRYPHLSYHYYRHAHRHHHSYYNFNRTVNVNINNNSRIDRSNLAKIDNNRGNILPKQWPSQRPAVGTDRPVQGPSTRPSTRPKSRPSTQPATRPSTTPSTRPSNKQAPPVNYNNYRSNEHMRQNWSRPSTPATRPATRPTTRPTGGFRRR